MKVYIVIEGQNNVVYRGLWFGCLNHCKHESHSLRVAVIRAGEREGHVIAEVVNSNLKQPSNRTPINAKSFK